MKIAFPQSAHVASESDIIQKMRLGVDGALLTTFGLAELYPDSLALSMPSYHPRATRNLTPSSPPSTPC